MQTRQRFSSAVSLVTALAFSAALPVVSLAQSNERGQTRGRRPSEEHGEDVDQQRAARSLFDAGTIAFRQLRYEDALESFSQAYKLTNDPVLLFSIGMSYDRLYRLPEAVQAFEAYLKAMPDAPNRPAAEERIRVIREHIDAQNTSSQPTPPPQAEPLVAPGQPVADPGQQAQNPPQAQPAEDDRGVRVVPQWVFWIGVGATAALTGATIWSGVDATNINEEHEREPPGPRRDAMLKSGLEAEDRTNVLIGATIGTAVLTGVLGIFFTDFGGRSKQTAGLRAAPQLNAWLNHTGSGVTLTQRF